jgi:hypothetical protein
VDIQIELTDKITKPFPKYELSIEGVKVVFFSNSSQYNFTRQKYRISYNEAASSA